MLVKAWVLALCARREEAAETISTLEQLGGLAEGPLPDGASSLDASLATLQAVFPWGDVELALESARRAAELEPPDSAFWPVDGTTATLLARLEHDTAVRPGDVVDLAVDTRRLYYFDLDTGVSIQTVPDRAAAAAVG